MAQQSSLGRRSLTFIRRALGVLAALVLTYAAILRFPEPAFAHRLNYLNYEIRSDQPIPPQITQVLDDTNRRLGKSVIHDSRVTDRIFFCNAPWRLWLYSGLFSTRPGATANGATHDIYVRASDIPANRIHSPGAGPIADAAQRPLSYFLAHEVTHADVYRRFGLVASVRSPQWLMEGYPDYVAKGGDFDFDGNHALFMDKRPELDFHRSGLYRGFHLKVAYLLDKQHATLQQLFAQPPSDAQLTTWLRQYRTAAKPL